MLLNLAQKIKLAPDNPGVYLFRAKNGRVIYVGKAKSLKNRLSSYTANNLGPKTSQMLGLAKRIEYVRVETEVEALLLEAEFVRLYKPKYNIQLKDDKTPIYIGITAERFPRVVLARKTQLKTYHFQKVCGPFTSAGVAGRLLKRIRKVFPFATHKLGKKACIYSQIGLCNPCPNTITTAVGRKKYLKNISMITKTLSGKITRVRTELEAEMRSASLNQDYERAVSLRDQIAQMDIFTKSFTTSEDYLANPNLLTDIRQKELQGLKKILSSYLAMGDSLSRIEGYDVAHLAGTFPTASMVTFVDGNPQKSLYRRFRINSRLKGDTDRLQEVLQRRKKHFATWGKPDLIIVDGGKPQVSAALAILGENFPVIGLAKRYETLIIKNAGEFHEYRLKASPARSLVQRLRDEAHRFARSYHHKLVAKAISNL